MVWRRRLYVKLPLPSENEMAAKRCYEEGRSRGFGVCLEAFCLLNGIVCCSVWFARDAAEGVQRMCSGLKLLIPVPLRTAKPVHSRFRWFAMDHLGARRESNALSASGILLSRGAACGGLTFREPPASANTGE